MNVKRVLVTGGAGFIGSHLCERLLHQKHEVICLDSYITGSESNIQHLKANPNFKLVCQDVTTPYFAEVDEIYNLACPASPISYTAYPIHTLKTSVVGALNMLELAKRVSAKVLQASTSEVYGDPQVHPQSEGYWGNVNPVGIRSCYNEGKRCAETLFMDYHRQYKLKVKIARIFNTYGPRMCFNDGRVVPNFIIQALSNSPITVYGDGSQTRSFQYVDDLVDDLIKLMGSSDSVTGPINLGNSQEISIVELANKVLQLVNSKSEIVYLPLPQDDPTRRQPDIAMAEHVIGESRLKVSLQEGLCKTAAYYKNHLNKSKEDLK